MDPYLRNHHRPPGSQQNKTDFHPPLPLHSSANYIRTSNCRNNDSDIIMDYILRIYQHSYSQRQRAPRGDAAGRRNAPRKSLPNSFSSCAATLLTASMTTWPLISPACSSSPAPSAPPRRRPRSHARPPGPHPAGPHPPAPPHPQASPFPRDRPRRSPLFRRSSSPAPPRWLSVRSSWMRTSTVSRGFPRCTAQSPAGSWSPSSRENTLNRPQVQLPARSGLPLRGAGAGHPLHQLQLTLAGAEGPRGDAWRVRFIGASGPVRERRRVAELQPDRNLLDRSRQSPLERDRHTSH